MCSITLRRSVVDRLGDKWFAEDLVSCEDWELRCVSTINVGSPCCRKSGLGSVSDDGARLGRAAPGMPPTREQEMCLLRDRLTVMERSHWLTGLDADLAAELERFRDKNARQLARLVQADG
jgi:hypothetical protein